MTKRTYLLILLTWFLGNASVYFIAPALPQIAIDFHSSTRAAQLAISLFLLGKALSMLLWGAISERYGRRAVFLVGVGLYTLANAFAVYSPSIDILLMARFIQGVAVGAPLLMGRAMINDTHNEQEATRQFGFLFSLAGLLICFLPLLGSFINSHFGWVGSFEVMAGYGFVLLLLCRGLSETRGPSHQAISLFVSISLVFRNNLFVRYLLISALMMAGESAFNTSASFILIQGAHYSQTAYGGVKTAMALTHVVGTLVCALLANYVTSASLVNYGLRLFAFAAGSMWLFTLNAYHVEWTFILPMMIYYFGTGFIVASTTAAAVRPFPKHMAIALALSLFCQFTLSAMASLITGLFAIERVIPFMILISVISILSLIIWSRSPGKSIYSRLIIEK